MPDLDPATSFAPRFNALGAPWPPPARSRQPSTARCDQPTTLTSVKKLEFLREGGSEKHLRDIRGILALTDVDRVFLQTEISRRDLTDAWQKCV